VDRACLVQDGYALAKAGHLAADDFVSFLASYVSETEYIVWDALSTVLIGFEKILIQEPVIYPLYCKFANALLRDAFATVGWEPRATDSHTDGLLRSDMVKLLAKFGREDPAVLAVARPKFAAFLADPETKELSDALKVPIAQIALKAGGAAELDQLFAMYQNAASNVLQKHVLLAVGAIGDAALKRKCLEWATSCAPGAPKLQEFFYVFASVSGSPGGLPVTWAYFQEAFPQIKSMLANASPSLFDAAFVYSVMGFCSEEAAKEIEAFFEKNPMPNNTRKMQQTVEGIRTNAKFLSERIAPSKLRDPGFWSQIPGGEAKL
jgi:aminopeptidase N